MRVLVLQFKRIGDAILTTPLLSAVRDHLPDAHITLALDAGPAALAETMPADRVLVFQRGLAGWRFWKDVATGNFDVCIDVTGNDRSALAAAASHAPRRITWSRARKKRLRSAIYTDFVESSVRNRHTVDHHTDLLQAFGVNVENVPASLALPASAEAEATLALTAAGIGSEFIVVHAGTARAEKYWLPERWATVIATLQAQDRTVVLTGSNDPHEQRHQQEIQAQLPARCPNLSGKLSLAGTAAVIGRARLLCAVDSAPVHLADALGTPLVALFGPTNPFHWRPRRSSSRIVTAFPGREITPDFPKAAMSEIPVEAVAEAVRAQLTSRPGSEV